MAAYNVKQLPYDCLLILRVSATRSDIRAGLEG
jgi:hypothetical protein